jgi:selT/selW/selH-like putative selenoprotein
VARDQLLKAHPSATVSLRRSGGGVFEVTVDGRLGYSKKATGRFPTEAEVLAVIAG